MFGCPALLSAEQGRALEAHSELGVTKSEIPTAPLYLTVPDIVHLVQTQNLDLFFQKESVLRALERSYQMRAALLPQISLSSSQSRQDQAFQQGPSFSGLGGKPYNAFNARISGTVTLIDADKYATYHIEKFNYLITQMDYEVVKQDLLQQALQLYFTHLQDLSRVEIIESTIARDRELLDLAIQQFDAGVAIKIDVTRAEVRVATERRNLMEAETLVTQSIYDLKALLDIDLDREVNLDRSIIEEIASPPSIKRYAAMGNYLEQRTELSRQLAELEQAQLARKAASWQRLPSIELFGDWGYDSNEIFDGDEQQAWLIGIRASMPLFEGGRIAAEKREADAAVRQNQYRMRTLRNRIVKEFRFAMIDMDSRYDQIEIAREEIRLGREEVSQAEERYREGLADNSELIDARQRLSDAENSHLRAAYLYGISRLAFARAIGKTENVLE